MANPPQGVPAHPSAADKPETIACAFASFNRDHFAEGPAWPMTFASLHVGPDEAERLLDEALPELAFDMEPFGVELSYILGYHWAIEFLEKMNGRYSVTPVDLEWQASSQPWARLCLGEHAVAWAKRLGSVAVICERHPLIEDFRDGDLAHYTKSPTWFSAFTPGDRVPRVVGPVEFATTTDRASVRLARIIAQIANQFLVCQWGDMTSWALGAHEIAPDRSFIEWRFRNCWGDVGVPPCPPDGDLAAAIASAGAMGFAARCAEESRNS